MYPHNFSILIAGARAKNRSKNNLIFAYAIFPRKTATRKNEHVTKTVSFPVILKFRIAAQTFLLRITFQRRTIHMLRCILSGELAQCSPPIETEKAEITMSIFENIKEISVKFPKAANLLNSLTKPAKGFHQFFDPDTKLDGFNELRDNADNIGAIMHDWSGNAPQDWQGLLLAKVNNSDDMRYVGVPTPEIVFNDATARELLYEQYVKMLAKALRDPEATETSFVTVAAGLRPPSEDAFKFQADLWVGILKRMELDRIDKDSLEMALSNAPYADSQFPGTTAEFWDRISHAMADNAIASGKSDAIFVNWRKTRNIRELEVKKPKEIPAGATLQTLVNMLSDKAKERFMSKGAIAATAADIKVTEASANAAE